MDYIQELVLYLLIHCHFNQLLAYTYAQKGESQKSYPYFKESLKYGEKSLPHSSVQQLRENVAGFMWGQNDKKGAVLLLEEWIKKSKVDKTSVFYLLGAFYSEVGRKQDAVCPAYFAAMKEAKPKKTYIQLLFSVHYELKDIEGSAKILKALVEYFPQENRFWKQLQQIYFQLDKVDESLAVLDMLYLRGKFETETDYKTLSQLLSYQEVPYRSAEILEDGINKGVVKADEDNWRAIARNYHASNELSKAIVAYGKTAEVSKNGKII